MENKITDFLKDSSNDEKYLHSDIPLSTNLNHSKWSDYIVELFNKKNNKILEIGSREVCGDSSYRKRFDKANYIGCDYYSGNNVDVICDAHKLSEYFNDEFDLIFSSAVFEHFAMPWVVAEQISKCLKTNGYVFVETHFTFSSHERPWHFFQFSDMALKALFNSELGFECIECGLSNPIVGRFSNLVDEYLRNKPVSGLYCHSEFLGKKVKQIENFDWNNINIANIVDQTKYPKRQS